jgi:hypothetical protein
MRVNRVVRDLGVMLAEGGDSLSDLGVVRDQQVLFGRVASDATAWRLVDALTEQRLDANPPGSGRGARPSLAIRRATGQDLSVADPA